MTRHLIDLKYLSYAEVAHVVDSAIDLKKRYLKGDKPELLKGKTLIMLFQKSSTRTRLSFEAGMTQLGGHAHFLTSDVMQVSHGESAKPKKRQKKEGLSQA